MAVILEPTDWDDPRGVALRLAQRAELDERYGRDDHEPGPKPSADDIDFFLVAVDESSAEAVACGGLRRLEPGVAEIKRMFVRPDHRGTGVSTAVLRALEKQAVRSGWPVLRLETGTEQPDAIRFYEREGYDRIELFGYYVGSDVSVCFERRL